MDAASNPSSLGHIVQKRILIRCGLVARLLHLDREQLPVRKAAEDIRNAPKPMEPIGVRLRVIDAGRVLTPREDSLQVEVSQTSLLNVTLKQEGIVAWQTFLGSPLARA
jgi:hypothetical protein